MFGVFFLLLLCVEMVWLTWDVVRCSWVLRIPTSNLSLSTSRMRMRLKPRVREGEGIKMVRSVGDA
jgi:hypothetical protein